MGKRALTAARALATLSTEQKNSILIAMAEGLDADASDILAANAKDKPFGDGRKDVATGGKKGKPKKITRPFITSCIGAGTSTVYATTEQHFKEIADAGGGSYGQILTSQKGTKNQEEVVRQILKMSFGKEWESEVKTFVEIFLEYRNKGFFR